MRIPLARGKTSNACLQAKLKYTLNLVTSHIYDTRNANEYRNVFMFIITLAQDKNNRKADTHTYDKCDDENKSGNAEMTVAERNE